jgi:hypothetical protein
MKMGAEAPIFEFRYDRKQWSGRLAPDKFFLFWEWERRQERIGGTNTPVKARNLRTVKPYIGERVIIERHQLPIGLLALPPRGKGPSRRIKKIYDGHSCTPLRNQCCAAQNLVLHCRKDDAHAPQSSHAGCAKREQEDLATR